MSRFRFVGAAVVAACCLLAAGPSNAGTLTWQETFPTLVWLLPDASDNSISWGGGTDTLTSNDSVGGSSNFSYSESASAAFHYSVTWTASYPGEPQPTNATITFNRYGANYANVGGGGGPSSSGSLYASAQSTSEGLVSASLHIPPGGNASSGSETLAYTGQVTASAGFFSSGGAWTTNIVIPAYAQVSGNGSFTFASGASSSFSEFKEVLASVGTN